MAGTCELPDGLTAASLKVARGSEIAFWISQANAAAGKRVMTKNGRVNDQRQRLAKHYGLDLVDGAGTSPVSVAPKTREEDIKERQFNWLRELGDEWSRTAAEGKEFVLCDRSSELCSIDLLREAVSLIAKLTMHATPSTSAISSTPLSLDGRTQTENNETVSAFIGAARGGDSVAISRLSGLGQLQGTTAVFAGTATPSPSPPVLPHVTSDMTVLNSCQLDIESMQCAQDLHHAIEQVENGAVGRIRERYGPRDDRAAEAMWGRLKGKVTKRERLYGLLTSTFQGDKDSFFQFFTVSAPVNDKKRRSGKRSEPKLVALRLVVEAILHCQRDLADERMNVRYIDPASGWFSEQLWRAVWGDRNDWYIWRKLGKEWYGDRKAP
ncbi:hypothetical protein DFJ58DRAFT_781829 [Suillus subalutaceus]|uniref:uncharacterized protein n=1 Tax=Suillus subalutaceus TaxID=48586 RepID=UPI001B86253C|nr:uncharacterized protein DFJ58DRAFT_781829 [Suillus subalutaceus]KAG1858357.1 hypothetical protein DFJ58DRAFT_781829 [Suillus subalutaceus]